MNGVDFLICAYYNTFVLESSQKQGIARLEYGREGKLKWQKFELEKMNLWRML